MTDFDPKTLSDMSTLNERLNVILNHEQKNETDPLSHRLIRLENRLDKIWDDHADTRKLTAILEERIKHLPTKPDLWKALAALFVGFTAVIAFAEKIQSLVR